MPALKFVRSVWESFRASSGLEPRLLDSLKVTHAVPGRVQFELQLEKHHTNRLNILHGGTIASMVDLGGSLAVASRGLYATGVSTDLNVTYLSSGGKIGDVVKAEVTCDKFGKTLAFTSIQFRNASDQVFARGSHTKYVALAWKDPNNIVEELSPKSGAKLSSGEGGASGLEKQVEEKREENGKGGNAKGNGKGEGKEKPGPQDEKVPEEFGKLPNVPS